MLKNLTWILLDGRGNVYTCTVTVLNHIHYINSDVRRHFLIDGYGIFPPWHRTISYPWTISVYEVLIPLSSPNLYTLYYIPSLFDPILTAFLTSFLVEGSPICRVSTYFHPMITLRHFANRDPCGYFVNKSAGIFSVLQYAIYILFISNRDLAKK